MPSRGHGSAPGMAWLPRRGGAERLSRGLWTALGLERDAAAIGGFTSQVAAFTASSDAPPASISAMTTSKGAARPEPARRPAPVAATRPTSPAILGQGMRNASAVRRKRAGCLASRALTSASDSPVPLTTAAETAAGTSRPSPPRCRGVRCPGGGSWSRRPSPARARPLGSLRRVEGLEDPGLQPRGYSGPVVGDRDPRAAALFARPDGQVAALRHRVDRVDHQVQRWPTRSRSARRGWRGPAQLLVNSAQAGALAGAHAWPGQLCGLVREGVQVDDRDLRIGRLSTELGPAGDHVDARAQGLFISPRVSPTRGLTPPFSRAASLAGISTGG